MRLCFCFQKLFSYSIHHFAAIASYGHGYFFNKTHSVAILENEIELFWRPLEMNSTQLNDMPWFQTPGVAVGIDKSIDELSNAFSVVQKEQSVV
jgi:hypothetical protein